MPLNPTTAVNGLSQCVLQSLIQQLAYELVDNTELPLKLVWLNVAFKALDVQDPEVRPNLPMLIDGLKEKLESFRGTVHANLNETLRQLHRSVHALVLLCMP